MLAGERPLKRYEPNATGAISILPDLVVQEESGRWNGRRSDVGARYFRSMTVPSAVEQQGFIPLLDSLIWPQGH